MLWKGLNWSDPRSLLKLKIEGLRLASKDSTGKNVIDYIKTNNLNLTSRRISLK